MQSPGCAAPSPWPGSPQCGAHSARMAFVACFSAHSATLPRAFTAVQQVKGSFQCHCQASSQQSLCGLLCQCIVAPAFHSIIVPPSDGPPWQDEGAGGLPRKVQNASHLLYAGSGSWFLHPFLLKEHAMHRQILHSGVATHAWSTILHAPHAF